MININTIKYSEIFNLRLKRKEKNVPWHIVPKDGTKAFCKQIGASAVEILREFPTLSDINLNNLPDSFVLKPENGHSDGGVMLLKKIEDNLYSEGFTRKEYNFQQIIEYQKEVCNKFNFSEKGKYLIEEYIPDIYGDLIPRDFKFFIFQGEIAIIMEVNRNKGVIQKHRFYEPDFTTIKNGKVIGLTPEFNYYVYLNLNLPML
ncbi:ATP-grasp fold amidoligase family protein [Mannheimia haemolytica]|uniref:ATP-grasp fold amidoligase family protein n=1 Tax=Mannheimia haemolytica TaxID=75985 RepID=UPI0031F5D950